MLNKLFEIEERCLNLIKESEDPEFTRYLLDLQKRLADHKQKVALLENDLNRNEKIYRQRMGERSATVGQVAAPMRSPAQAQMVASAGRVENAAAPAQAQMVASAAGVDNAAAPVQAQKVASAERVENAAAPAQGTTSQPSFGKKAEFAIGGTVLSILGSVFVLASLVMLGMNFMSGFAKGMILYFVCISVMLLAELLVYRRYPKLGMTLSAIGMGGLYISTLVNHLVLQTMNQWVALGIVLAITVVIALLSRKRDAAAYRILGMIAVYVSGFLLLQNGQVEGGFGKSGIVTISVFALLVNLTCLFIPVMKGHTTIQITHMVINTLFTAAIIGGFLINLMDGEEVNSIWDAPIFLALSFLTTQFIYMTQLRWQKKRTPDAGMLINIGILAAYGFCGCIYCILMLLVTNLGGFVGLEDGFSADMLDRLILCGAIAGMTLLPIVVLRGIKEKWFSWYFLHLLVLMVASQGNGVMEWILYVTGLLVLAKLISFTGEKILIPVDIGITVVACLTALCNADNKYTLLLILGLVVGVLCINYMNTAFECIIWFTLTWFSQYHMPQLVKLPVLVGMLLIGILIFNNVPRWKDKGILAFNLCSLAGMGIAYLCLINPVYSGCYLTYLCMLLFGVTTIVVCIQKKYAMEIRGKEVLLGVFLTYMGFVVRTGVPIINSIFLMIIALGCVSFGFILKKKAVRFYGLGLSLVVCAKLVLYDFAGVNAFQKMILFFVVGMIALVIAGIYMILERIGENRQKEASEKEVTL